MKRIALLTAFSAAFAAPSVVLADDPASVDSPLAAAAPASPEASPSPLTGKLGLFTHSQSDNGSGLNTGSRTRDAGHAIAAVSVSRSF